MTDSAVQNFFKGRRVFVTGNTGFKGSWLCLLLHRLGATVHGYALPAPTSPSLFELARVRELITHTDGDVRDGDKLRASLKKSDPEVVIHMAAQPLVRQSYVDPVGTYTTNVMGTVNLLESVRLQGNSVRSVVVVTSDKCYENKEWVWGYRENETLGGYDPYSSSKACAEIVTATYRRSFFAAADIPVASARAGNVIGGGDFAADRLVPDIIRGFAANTPVLIRSPHSHRPWQFVLEPLMGYLLLASTLGTSGQQNAEGWNFGPSETDAMPVDWIVKNLAGHWGGNASWEYAKEIQPHEANALRLDISKARHKLGWSPRTNLAVTLRWLTDWYKAHHQGQNLRDFSLTQIEQFLERPLEMASRQQA